MTLRKNHRILVTERGGADVLQLIEEDLPEPGAGDATELEDEPLEFAIRVLAPGGWEAGRHTSD